MSEKRWKVSRYAYFAGRSGAREMLYRYGHACFTPSINEQHEWNHAWADFMRGWHDESQDREGGS